MKDNEITFYPVGNGDTVLIRLKDGTTILIDCRIRSVEAGIYDVRGDLLEIFRKDSEGRPHLDVLILTHPDQDHCGGFPRFFYCGNPEKYGEDDTDDEKIIIDELWFAPRIFQEYSGDLCDDAKAFRREAKRRINLYKSGSQKRNKPGNRLRAIGATDNDDLEGLDAIITIPGNTVNLFNGKLQNTFRFFVYGPVKADSDDQGVERNDTSIIVQARFDVDNEQDAARIFLGGDAGCEKWKRIIGRNDDDNLEWDLFLAPHHCSWGFFSEDPLDQDNPKPNKTILHLLDLKRGSAWIISSSKPIEDNDDNPPCYEAAQIYKAKVGKERFLCTGEHPDEDNPEPIVFTMSANGPVRDDPRNQNKASVFIKPPEEPRTYG